MKIFYSSFLICVSIFCQAQVFTTVNGDVDFVSEAPLEIIKASSNQMQGVLDLSKKTFAFKMYIKSFDGFNSPLQKVHFFENYMEANEYPIATFKGKILENIKEEKGSFRAKGMLLIHGIETERILEVSLDVSEKNIEYSSSFKVLLIDHDIDLPRIVYQKIAEEILVKVEGDLILKE